jgi:glycosyltransferase involved in cell wall biosynthesis
MYIIHLGFSGFPTGNAAVQRVKSTFKAIKYAGYTPVIINKQSVHKKVDYNKRVNRFEDLIFIDTSPVLIKQDSFIKRNLNKLQGIINEFGLLRSKKKKIHSAIFYASSFYELMYYRLLSKLFGFNLVIQYVEHRSSIPERDSFFTRINDKLFDRYCSRFCDGVIAISEFLKNEIYKKNPELPVLKIPAVCNFEDFETVKPASFDFSYYLYCGTVYYVPVVEFVLSFFEKVKDEQIYNGKIIFIIGGGDKKNHNFIKELFEKSRYKDDVILHSNIPYDTLLSLYKSAELLIIPLRNNIQDIARFPHKVSEYTASGRPLISSKIGELKHYFINQESALLADEYNVDMYVNTMRKMKAENVDLDEIGRKGHEIGYNNFHYLSHVENLKTFFNKL